MGNASDVCQARYNHIHFGLSNDLRFDPDTNELGKVGYDAVLEHAETWKSNAMMR